MEFNLSPLHIGDDSTPVSKTPYVADEQWTGGKWISYPAEKGKSYFPDGGSTDLTSYFRAERLNPTPTREQESFLQTWLYFGLICQFIGINFGTGNARTANTKTTIDKVYSLILKAEDGQNFVKLDEDGLRILRDIGLSQLPEDRESRKAHYDQMIVCLSCTHAISGGLPPDFDYMVKYSIASLGEVFTQTVNFALDRLQLPKTFGRIWSDGLLDADSKATMRNRGWCPSGIARAEANIKPFRHCIFYKC